MLLKSAQLAWDNLQETENLEANAIESIIINNEKQINIDFLSSDEFIENIGEWFEGSDEDFDDLIDIIQTDPKCDYLLELSFDYSDTKKLNDLIFEFSEQWAKRYIDENSD